MSRNFKKISVASALVAATTLPTTMVSALETNVKNDSNTPVTLSSERRGWYEEYGYKYYYDDNGELLKGLQEIDGNTYYFYSYDGHMAYSSWYDEDTITDNGLIVTVDKSGIVTNHANIVAGDWTHYGDRWYYYDADMNPYIGVKTINGVKYYFEWEGRLATRTYEGIWVITFNRQLIAYNQNGVVTDQQDIVGNKWIKVNNKWYYFDKNLNPYQGVQKVDGVEYFFWSDGQLATYDYDGIYTATSNNYLVSYKHDIHFGDIFILGCYVFLIFIYPFLFFSLFKPLLTAGYVYLFYLLAGFISKIILISFTYWLVKHFKYNITVPNKQYSLVIIIEIIILGVLVIVGYSTINTSADYSPFIICFLLIIVFILIIANGIYFNMVYTEKMQYEKQLQKEKYIKQSLRLIQNISYDIDDKKHRIHWILEHIKHLNNDTNPEISKAIEQYQSKNTYQKLVASKNPVFDILISVKINRLQDDNISIKPFFEISQNEKYDDLDFIDVISEILDYVKRHNEITLHIKGQGIYTLVELYSENDFYDYDRCKIESDLIVKKKNIYKDGIYYMKFLLKGTDDDVRENL